MYMAVKSLMFYNVLQWKNQEMEKALNTGRAEAENVGRFWLARNKKTPNEYYDTKDAAAQANETAAPKRIEVTAKTLDEVLAYAARFQTDDGMTAYLKRAVTVLPEADRGTVEDLLKQSPADIRKTIQKGFAA